MKKSDSGPRSTRRPNRTTEGETVGSGVARGPGHVNEVHLVGRVTSGPEERTLPSGAQLVTFRVSVRRSPTVMTRGSSQVVDVVDCVAWSAQTRRVAASRSVGDSVEVRGSIRRRFFRSADGAASRIELEVLSLTSR